MLLGIVESNLSIGGHTHTADCHATKRHEIVTYAEEEKKTETNDEEKNYVPNFTQQMNQMIRQGIDYVLWWTEVD